MDEASTQGVASHVVFDANWGSVFPCANGAASSMVMKHVLGQAELKPRVLSEEVQRRSLTGVGRSDVAMSEAIPESNNSSG